MLRPQLAVSVLVPLLSFAALPAQCAPFWVPGSALRGVDGSVRSSAWWDPDGSGPLGARLVFVGVFTAIADVAARRIASWDPATDTWAEVGGGANGTVHDVVALPNGDLVVIGEFTAVGGVAANRIARLQAGSWSPLGTGLGGFVPSILPWAVTALPNGDLVAGGDFSSAGGLPVQRVARWDGSAWHALGSGVNGYVADLLPLPNGDLLAGGFFITAGGLPVGKVARWDGAAWHALGSGLDQTTNADVRQLELAANGDVLVAGTFSIAGGQPANGLARWNGSAWTPIQVPFGNGVSVVRELVGGQLLAAPASASVQQVDQLHVGGVGGWQLLSPPFDSTIRSCVVLPNGELFAFGSFTRLGDTQLRGIARWTGSEWQPIRPGFDAQIQAVVELEDGSLVVAGAFQRAPGLFANGLARFDGVAWSTFGTGLAAAPPSTLPQANAVLAVPGGGFVVAGRFASVDGVAVANIAQWNGVSWSSLGGGIPGTINALARAPNGDVYAGGFFQTAGGVPANHVARWDGSSWWPLAGGLGPSAIVNALAVLPNGDLVAGGTFNLASGAPANSIARFDGLTWSPLGGGLDNSVHSLVVLPNGELAAGGVFFTPSPRVARWNGSTWQPYGTGIPGVGALVQDLAALPNGDLVVGGATTPLGANLVRWNGGAFVPFAGGTSGTCNSLATLRRGGIAVGGSFFRVQPASSAPQVAANFALLLPSCPAFAVATGSGCGSPLTATLAARTLPWLGSSHVAEAGGLPTSSLALVGLGFQPASVPLAAVLPQADAACTLQLLPDLTVLQLPQLGSLTVSWAVPTAMALLGSVLHEQVVALGLGPTGNIQSAVSTNALALSFGTL